MAEVDRRPEAQAHDPGTEWLLVLAGLLTATAAVIVLANPSIGLATLAVIAGVFLLIDGIIETFWSLVGAGDDWRGFCCPA
jgi:uncharacterized membrane protein HdeD (DUF308 family)